MGYEGPERRATTLLTEEQLNEIAERAADRALEKVYAQIGKSVVTKLLWVIGTTTLAIAAWLKGSGKW
jgi:hypothetical protein